MRNLKFYLPLVLSLAVSVAFSQEPVQAPTVAVTGLPPGISMPTTGMVHALDTTANGPAWVRLHPTEIASNGHAAGNFARSMVYAGAHATVELNGPTSSVSLTSPKAVFYVRINSEEPELMREQLHLIRLQQKKDRRVISTFSQNVFGGQRAKRYDDVAVTKTDVEPDVWVKVTPLAPLAPGTYCIAFMPKDSNVNPGEVYDFDISGDGAKQ